VCVSCTESNTEMKLLEQKEMSLLQDLLFGKNPNNDDLKR